METNLLHSRNLHPPLKSDVPVYYYRDLTKQIIGCAIEVHRKLGKDFLRKFMKKRFHWN